MTFLAAKTTAFCLSAKYRKATKEKPQVRTIRIAKVNVGGTVFANLAVRLSSEPTANEPKPAEATIAIFEAFKKTRSSASRLLAAVLYSSMAISRSSK